MASKIDSSEHSRGKPPVDGGKGGRLEGEFKQATKKRLEMKSHDHSIVTRDAHDRHPSAQPEKTERRIGVGENSPYGAAEQLITVTPKRDWAKASADFRHAASLSAENFCLTYNGKSYGEACAQQDGPKPQDSQPERISPRNKKLMEGDGPQTDADRNPSISEMLKYNKEFASSLMATYDIQKATDEFQKRIQMEDLLKRTIKRNSYP